MLSIYELQQRPETNKDNSPIIYRSIKWLLWWNIEIIKSKYADVYTNLYCIIPKSLMLGIEIFSYFSYSDCSWEMFNGMLSTELCSFWVCSLQWRHNERNGVSNHRRLYGLLNRLFRRSLKHQNIKVPRHWPLWGEFTGHRCRKVYVMLAAVTRTKILVRFL